jgi:hypothetical protein
MITTTETPTHDITVAGMIFAAPAPYTEGHTLTANEAAVLNQTLAENLRNNFASQVKKAVDAAAVEGAEPVDEAALSEAFTTYVAGYEFGVRRTGSGGGRVTLDPIDREALKLAIEKVKAAIKAKGIVLKDVPNEVIRVKAEEVLAKYPQIREQAIALIALKAESATEELDLDLDS